MSKATDIAVCRDRTFVVTGVSSGIGAALAGTIEAAGGRVIGIDRRSPVNTITAFVACDLSDPDQIGTAACAIEGPVDGLINVAGVPGSATTELVTQVNFLAVRELTKALLPKIADRGAVVNVASAAGVNWRSRLDCLKRILAIEPWDETLSEILALGHNGPQAYDFSKELVILYTALSASSQFHRGIRVNSVSPGAVSTPILRDFYDTMGSELLDRIKKQAGGRDATPSDIVGPILFLLGESASWVNGTDLLVDGGGEVAMTLPEIAIPPLAQNAH